MGKSKRKRKIKEEDFKKKKLKVGKRLPMPDNVTKTSFKAGSIRIQQQVKQDDESKKLNIKDLLSSCSHYNTQAREDTLTSLKDLFEKHPKVLTDNLSEILKRTLDKIIDIESSVRRAALALFYCIFKHTSSTEITPFFPNIVAYLCSAMTHINEGIQMDSMKYLDHCISFHPQLLRYHSRNIIQNFINVISSEKGDGGKSVVVKRPMLRAKVTSQKMQLEVLSRLNKLLKVVFPVPSKDGTSITNYNGTIDHGTIDVYDTIPNNNDGICIPSAFINVGKILTSNFTMTTSSELCHDVLKLEDFIARLSPVLFDYWVECCPAEFVTSLVPVNRASIALHIMKEILEILIIMVKTLKGISSEEMCNKFINKVLFEQLTTHVLSVFPLCYSVQQSKKKKDVNQTIPDIIINLLITELFFMFKINNESPPKYLDTISKYLSNALHDKSKRKSSSITVDNIKFMSNLVSDFLVRIPVGFDDVKVELFRNIFQLFQECHSMSNIKKVLLTFLEDLFKSPVHLSPELQSIVDTWLCLLKKLAMASEISLQVKSNVFTLWKFGVIQGYPKLCQSINKELEKLFEPAVFKSFDEKAQYILIEILFHAKQQPSRKLFEVLTSLCNSCCLSLSVFQYLLQMLHLISECELVTPKSCETIADFLSFMLSIIVSKSKDELTQLPTNKVFQHHSNDYKLLFLESTEHFNEIWCYHKSTIEIICQYIALDNHSEYLIQLLAGPLTTMLDQYKTLPLMVVYRVLSMVKTMLPLAQVGTTIDQDFVAHLANWCNLILHFVHSTTVPVEYEVCLKLISNDLTNLLVSFANSSFHILQNMVSLLQLSTLSENQEYTTTTRVLTTLLKHDIFKNYEPRSEIEKIKENLDNVCNSDLIDDQAFSDFMSQYSLFLPH